MHESELLSYYLDVFLAMLTSPLGAAGLLGLIALAVSSVTVPNMRWVLVVAAVYFATLPLIDTRRQYLPLAFPMEQFRQFARPMIYLFMTLLLLPLVTTTRGWRRVILPLPLLLFFIFELTICLRLLTFGGELRGILSLLSYVLLILTLGLAVSRSLQSFEDLYKLIWCLSWIGGLVVLGTVYQLIVNRTPIISGSRLTGVTGNPQFLGILIAYTLPFTAHLLTRPSGKKWIRPLLIAQVTLMVVMLIWTGSRTGALSTAVGLMIAFHRRLGRFLIAGVLVLVAVLLVMPYFEGSSEIASRLLSTVDTRAGVWPTLLRNIRENFWFGAAREMFETHESSYLSILGQFGIIGSLPFIAAMFALAYQMVQMYRLRRFLGTESGLVDLITGVWGAVAVSSAFESLLVGVITFPILMIYTFFMVNAFLLDWAQGTAELTGYQLEQGEYQAAAA